MLENKPLNDITLRVGLGWEHSLQDGQIRSSSDIADEISMPVDFSAMQARNSPDVEVRRGDMESARRGAGGWARSAWTLRLVLPRPSLILTASGH